MRELLLCLYQSQAENFYSALMWQPLKITNSEPAMMRQATRSWKSFIMSEMLMLAKLTSGAQWQRVKVAAGRSASE